MVTGKWFITPHAVRRYIERVDLSASYEEALAELIRWSEVARPKKKIAPGVWLYRGPRPLRLRLRVSHKGPGLPQLMTVLKSKDPGW
jgi:hypothetical protein